MGFKMCESGVMSQTVSLVLSQRTREALKKIANDRRHAGKHVLRARIVLLSDERLPVLEIARQAEVSSPMVWRWQQRFAEEGLEGLLRDKTRLPGKPATPQAEVQAVLERTLTGEPPGATTHWTGRAMAAVCGLSLRTVQRIWDAHCLQPHRVRTFKRRTDSRFAAKLDDVVGLYMSPPWDAATGPSSAPTPAAIALRSSTPSSRPASWAPSIPRPTWPMSWAASPTIRPGGSTSCCPATGRRPSRRPDSAALATVHTLDLVAERLGRGR